MQILLELLEKPVNILEEKLDESGKMKLKVSGVFQQADKINSNGRRYGKAILGREINKLNEKIKRGESVWGAAYHPKKGYPETSDISHKFSKFSMDEEGVCHCEMTVLPTAQGQNIGTLLKAGSLGLSSRGRGKLSAQKTEIVDGQSVTFRDIGGDFCLDSVDFVISPSVKTAQATLSESMTNLESALNGNDGKQHPTLSELMQEMNQKKMENRDYENMSMSELMYFTEKDNKTTNLSYEVWLKEQLVEMEKEAQERLDQRRSLFHESLLGGFKRPGKVLDFLGDEEAKRQQKLIETELKKGGVIKPENLTENERKIIGKTGKRGI